MGRTGFGKQLTSCPHVGYVNFESCSSGIIKSGQDSGLDHVHAKYEPDRYQKQIKLAYDLLDFSKLGVIYDDTEIGRIYANLEDIKKSLNRKILK